MNFTYEELARLNTMIGIALMSGKVEFDKVSESVHKKASDELFAKVQKQITENELICDEI